MKLSSALLLAACASAQSLDTATVTSAVLDRTVKLPAEILPYQKVALTARVPGLIQKVDVDRGSTVKTGQLLITLDAPEMKAQIAEAEAKAKAIEAQKAEGEAKLAAAESTLDRLNTASATPGAVAGNDVVQASKAADSLRGLIRAIDSSAAAARASAATLRDMAAYLNIIAPFDGIITARYVHPGALAGPSSGPLLELEQVSRLRVVVAVPESETANILRGAKVPFTVPAHPGRTFAGAVARIPASLDPKTRTMPVELDAANPDGALAPGMYAEAAWPVRRSRASLFVPATAVVTTTERTFVIRVRDGKAEYVSVSRGIRQGDNVEVIGPLNSGDVIVKRATDEIREGQAIPAAAGRRG